MIFCVSRLRSGIILNFSCDLKRSRTVGYHVKLYDYSAPPSPQCKNLLVYTQIMLSCLSAFWKDYFSNPFVCSMKYSMKNKNQRCSINPNKALCLYLYYSLYCNVMAHYLQLRKRIDNTEISWALGAMFELLKDGAASAPAAR